MKNRTNDPKGGVSSKKRQNVRRDSKGFLAPKLVASNGKIINHQIKSNTKDDNRIRREQVGQPHLPRNPPYRLDRGINTAFRSNAKARRLKQFFLSLFISLTIVFTSGFITYHVASYCFSDQPNKRFILKNIGETTYKKITNTLSFSDKKKAKKISKKVIKSKKKKAAKKFK